MLFFCSRTDTKLRIRISLVLPMFSRCIRVKRSSIDPGSTWAFHKWHAAVALGWFLRPGLKLIVSGLLSLVIDELHELIQKSSLKKKKKTTVCSGHFSNFLLNLDSWNCTVFCRPLGSTKAEPLKSGLAPPCFCGSRKRFGAVRPGSAMWMFSKAPKAKDSETPKDEGAVEKNRVFVEQFQIFYQF